VPASAGAQRCLVGGVLEPHPGGVTHTRPAIHEQDDNVAAGVIAEQERNHPE
jgi:hypothetical protein